MEAEIVKEIIDTTEKSISVISECARAVWSLLDAASEKTQPAEVLSQNAIRSIQGVSD